MPFPHIVEKKDSGAFFYSLSQNSTFMKPSKFNYLLKVLPPNTITLGSKTSIYEFGSDTTLGSSEYYLKRIH
jgi:hypothetical protein